MNDDQDKIALDSLVARQIVKEIMDFGVSQVQIVYIIRLLSLELENTILMNKINGFLDESEMIDDKEKPEHQNHKKKIYT